MKEEITEFFKTNISCEEKDGICEITTPFLDVHNDNLCVYLSQEENGLYRLSDGGYLRFETTVKNIHMFLGTTRFKNEDEVYTIVEKDKIPQAFFDLITLMLIEVYNQ